jgi:hypothetical protein
MKIATTPSRLVRLTLLVPLAALTVAIALEVNATPAVPTVTQADFEKLQDQVRALDKDHALMAARIEGQNNRIGDLSLSATQLGNHIAAASNHTATMGSFFGLLGIFIPVLLIVAGLLTYRKAKSDAKDMAKECIEAHTQDLTAKIADLQARTLTSIPAE